MYDKRTGRLTPVLGAVAVTLLVSLATLCSAASPAAGLQLPPVKLPPVTVPPVKTPPVKAPPVKAPTPPPVTVPPVKLPTPPPVKAPPVKLPTPPPVKAPPVKLPAPPPVKLPPVKVETPPVKAPPVKLPAPPLKAPPLQPPAVKAPPAPKAPSLKVTPGGGRPAAGPSSLPVTAPVPRVSVTAVRSAARSVLTGSPSSSRRTVPLSHADVSAPPAGNAASPGVGGAGVPAIVDGLLMRGGSPAYGGSAELPDLARLLAEGHGKLDASRLRAFVFGLRGCVRALTPRLRTVLRLRSGLGEPRPLSRAALAIRLRISRRHVRSLEVKALRALLHAARATGCAGAPQQAPSRVLFASYVPGTAATSPAFGVESAREERSPAVANPPQGAVPPPASQGLRPGSSVFWLLGAVLLAVAVIALGVLDNLGIGPRHRYRGGIRRRR